MPFRDYPIERKLLVIILVTTGAALLVAGLGFIGWDQYAFRHRLLDDVLSIAEIAAHDTAGAVAFDDAESARQTLEALRVKEHVVAACLYRADGSVLARYSRDNTEPPCPPVSLTATAQVGREFFVSQPVTVQQRTLGNLTIRYDTGELHERLLVYGGVVVGVLLLASFGAIIFSAKMRKSIARPITSLSETARAVSQQRDYSVRARKISDDEVGALVDAFNQMLAAVQERDESLRRARDELELRVADRTRELRLSEERFRALVERVEGYAIILLDPNGIVASWNAGAKKIKGWEAEEIIGKHFSIFYPPEGHRHAERNLEVARTKGHAEDEGWRVRKDGTRFWSSALLTALRDDDGNLLGFSKITRDLTARKQQEEALRLLADVSAAASSADDVDTAITLALREIGRQRDWQLGQAWLPDPTGEFLLCAPRSFYSTQVVPALRRASLDIRFRKGEGLPGRVWEGGEPVSISEGSSGALPRGKLFEEAGFISCFAFPIFYDNTFWGVLEFFSTQKQEPDEAFLHAVRILGHRLGDILARKQAEQSLRAQAEELARSNADLAQFAYAASHDLQEPLRMVISYMQIISEQYKGKLDADADEFIGFAVEGAMRMRQLITGLLAYSRVGSGGHQNVPVNLSETLAQVLSNLSVAIDESKATIEIGPMPTVVADPAQMVQLFQNLIANALVYRSAAPPLVRVSAVQHEGTWEFAVSDNGIGIAEEHYERIFRIFQRLHDRIRYKGTGMGLAICKRIVERRGGRIWVESKLGEGSTFRFTIPSDSPVSETEVRRIA